MAAQQRNALMGGLAIIAIAAAAVVFFTFRGGREKISEQFTGNGVCLACQWDGEFSYARDDRAPYVCPDCGDQAVYLWYYCNDCKHRFVPELDRSTVPPRIPIGVTCTNCGGRHVTQYIPKAMLEPPAGDAKLPAWP